jgi:predicted enzyme related to lactoylglutathione lyase
MEGSMDFETVSAADFGRSLMGIGVNLLSPDVRALAGFLHEVFGLRVHRLSDSFAIVTHHDMVLQLHADGAFGAHPLLGLVPEMPPRGAGAQFYLFWIDPDAAAARAEARGDVVIEPPKDKPHGLRECTVLSPEGYAFSPAVHAG